MTMVSVFVCPGASQTVATDSSGNQYPACAAGQGSYQQVTIAEPWNPSQLDTTQLMAAGSAGFIIAGTGLAIMMCIAVVVRTPVDALRQGKN